MSPEDLVAFTRRQPFEPFRVVLTDGATYEIRHPDMILPTRRTVTIGIPAEPGQEIAERSITAALLHVVRVEPMERASKA